MKSAWPRARRHAIVVTIALTLAACGGGDDDAGSEPSTPATTSPVSMAAGSTAPDTAAAGSTAPAATSPGATAAASTSSSSPTAPAGTSPGSAAPATPTTTTTTVAGGPSSSSPSATTSTYVVVAGDTLIGIADEAGVSLEELVAANDWDDGESHIIRPGDVVQLPTAGATAGAGELPDGAVPASELLELEPVDGVSAPIETPLADGIYFAIAAEPAADGTTIQLQLAQFLTSEACEDRLSASTQPGETIDTAPCQGYQVIETPTTTVDVPVEGGPPVIVMLPPPPDVDDIYAYQATTEEWRQLLDDDGDGPAWASAWLPGNAFVEITDGAVSRIEVSVIGS